MQQHTPVLPSAVLHYLAPAPGTIIVDATVGAGGHARLLAERDVRFIQLVHRDWDHHGDLPNQIRNQAKQTDQASAALIMDFREGALSYVDS